MSELPRPAGDSVEAGPRPQSHGSLPLLRRTFPPAAAALSGLLLAFAYPPFGFDWLVWLWPFPLLWALWLPGRNLKHVRLYGFGLGFISGLVFFLVAFSWIREVSGLGAILLPAYLALYPGLWGSVTACLAPPQLPAPRSPRDSTFEPNALSQLQGLRNLALAFLTAGVWVSLEWLRGWLFTGFGWNGLGVALYRQLPLIQAADIFGVTGLSFLVLFVSVSIFLTGRRILWEARSGRFAPHPEFFLPVGLLCALVLYGASRLTPAPFDSVPLRVLLVQLNIPQDVKWDPAHQDEIRSLYEDFTRLYVDQEASRPDLVLWPETALPGELEHPDNVALLERLAGAGEFHLLLGIQEYDYETQTAYNSAALLRSGLDDAQVYRKIHLVPFGEFLPLRGRFPPFEWAAGDLIPSDFGRGSSTEPLLLHENQIGLIPLICFEDTLGRLARRFVHPGPQLLVNLTNDGWFGQSAASEQHLANALFRCVELRRPMARAANTGVSCVIDSTGSLVDREDTSGFLRVIRDTESGSTFVRGCLPASLSIPAAETLTLYARWGDWFVAVVALASLPALFRWLRPKQPASV